MASLELKEYQRESLDVISRFGDAVRAAIDAKAMRPVHDAYWSITQRDYIDVPQLPGVPYVCLRVPTGGGKTLIAAHAVGRIAKHLGHQDRPLCLWVTPSTTIRDQTLRGLRDRSHPYHTALRDGLGGASLEVMTIEEALSANRAMLSGSAVVVVTTIQSYRIRNDRGELEEATRKVYEDNGYLMDHFTNLDARLLEKVREPGTGALTFSLANVFRLRGPIVIMDEAHNARTQVSFDSLERFGPLAVLELTATPQQDHDPDKDKYASNVLHAVSALQLKREGMIKLPIELESRDNWLEVLALTVQKRKALAQRAAEWGRDSGRFIRPIALVQAQPKNKNRETHTADKVKEALIQRFGIAPESVRICTGSVDELGDENLHRPESTVEYVVTVDKLREGWDCHFAYVLGSVGKVATETAVEQILGRILRMPGAKPTGVPELDRAYAIVQSEDVARTAQNLADSMVNRCGFDRASIGDVLRVHRRRDDQPLLALTSIPVSTAPNLAQLPPAVRSKVRYDSASGRIQVHQPLTRDDAQSLRDALPAPADRTAVEDYWNAERDVGTVPKALDQYVAPIRIPQLAIRDGRRWLRFEPIELDEFTWDLNACDPKFGEAEFSADLHVGDRVLLDVADQQGAVRVGGVEQVIARQLTFLPDDDRWEKPELIRWFDSELHRGGQNAGLAAAESQAWLNRVVDYLSNERGISMAVLVRKRHELANDLFHRITDHGRKQVRKAAEQLFAADGDRQLVTAAEFAWELAEQDYAPYRRYSGTFTYQKHAFDLIGGMNNEERHCAKRIDDHPNVKRWVRNLEHESAGGFSLPLSPGRFFPDFVVELNDGRIALVEYKGPHIASDPKELHKEDVGKLWEARSGGKCVFVRVVDQNWPTLEAKLNA